MIDPAPVTARTALRSTLVVVVRLSSLIGVVARAALLPAALLAASCAEPPTAETPARGKSVAGVASAASPAEPCASADALPADDGTFRNLAEIRGRVLGEQGEPVTDVLVEALALEHSRSRFWTGCCRHLGRARSGPDGAFAITTSGKRFEASAAICARASWRVEDAFYEGASTLAASVLPPNGSDVVVEVKLAKRRHPFGRLTTRVTAAGRPVVGALVVMGWQCGDTDFTEWGGAESLTDEHGETEDNVNAYGIGVQVSADGFASEHRSLARVKADDVVLEVALATGVTVSGAVRDPAGKPLAGSWVVAWNAAAPGAHARAVGAHADDDGRYVLRGLVAGQAYRIAVEPITPLGLAGTPVAIVAESRALDLVLGPSGALDVHAAWGPSEGERAVEDLRIFLERCDVSGAWVPFDPWNETTRSSGSTLAFEGLAPGAYRALALAEEAEPCWSEPVVVEPANRTLAKVVLRRGRTVRGRLVDAKGRPVGDATIGIRVNDWVYGVGLDEPVRMVVSHGRERRAFYYCQNAVGSVVALTDARGKVVERYAYQAFGQEVVLGPEGERRNGSAFGNPIRFQGRWRDAEEGSPLLYYRARYYSPETGRFTSRDPIGVWGDPSQFGNGYGAFGNNGINRLDPLGLDTTLGKPDPATKTIEATVHIDLYVDSSNFKYADAEKWLRYAVDKYWNRTGPGMPGAFKIGCYSLKLTLDIKPGDPKYGNQRLTKADIEKRATQDKNTRDMFYVTQNLGNSDYAEGHTETVRGAIGYAAVHKTRYVTSSEAGVLLGGTEGWDIEALAHEFGWLLGLNTQRFSTKKAQGKGGKLVDVATPNSGFEGDIMAYHYSLRLVRGAAKVPWKVSDADFAEFTSQLPKDITEATQK